MSFPLRLISPPTSGVLEPERQWNVPLVMMPLLGMTSSVDSA